MDKIDFPTFQYGHYYTDIIHTSDSQRFLSLLREPKISRWLVALGEFNDISDVYEFIDIFRNAEIDGRGMLRAIRCQYNSKMIGFIGLCDLSFDPSVFYALSPDMWGQGIATEMVKSITSFLHDAQKPIVRASADKNNLHSIRVLERNGFIYDEIENEFVHSYPDYL